jgi:hypothetical protein
MTALVRIVEPIPPGDRRGRRSVATIDAIARRDALIYEAAILYFGDTSANDAAHRLHQALNRYACGPWRRARTADFCPPRHAGRLAGFCWQILRERDYVLSSRSIRLILSRHGFCCQRSSG